MDKGIWVFLSHSNKDYEKVRQVRNILEQQGYRPLMFFLNCLNDDNEIDGLIKREIDSREKFILCDSMNAQNSKWVQEEVNYIKKKNRLWEKINVDSSIEDIKKSLFRFQSRNTIYVNGTSDDTELKESIVRYFRTKDYDVINKESYEDRDFSSHGYFINIYSFNILLKNNTPRFVMNYNSFLHSNHSKEETIIINIFIDAREELLREYYKDPGVDKYEGFIGPNNKIIDIDYSEKNKEDLPSLIYNFLREIDNSINNIFNYAEGCRRNVIEIKALEKCIDLECAYIEPDKLKAFGFSFENNNEYIIYDSQSIIRSTAMFELACNYFVKKSYNKAIELFYSASILGMKNAQKVLYELGPSLLPSRIIDKIKKSAFKSADGFPEYLLAKSVEYKQAFLGDKDAVLHLYEYSAKKGCMFGCEEINGLYAMPQDTNINQKFDKRYNTCWYEHCLMEYPNRIYWEKLQEYIVKQSKCK